MHNTDRAALIQQVVFSLLRRLESNVTLPASAAVDMNQNAAALCCRRAVRQSIDIARTQVQPFCYTHCRQQHRDRSKISCTLLQRANGTDGRTDGHRTVTHSFVAYYASSVSKSNHIIT